MLSIPHLKEWVFRTYLVNCAVVSREEILPMITLSYEALFALIAICGGAGYMLGKDVSKAKK